MFMKYPRIHQDMGVEFFLNFFSLFYVGNNVGGPTQRGGCLLLALLV